MIDDKTAENFSKYMKKYSNLYKYLADVVKKYAFSKNPLIIDLGVGPGLLSKEIHSKIPSAKIIGIDPLEKMIELAKNNVNYSEFEARIGSSENLPVDDNSADIVVSRFSLSYWNKPEKCFKNIYKVLKKDGYLILEVINKDFPAWQLFVIKLHMFFNKATSAVIKYHIDVYKRAYNINQVEAFLLNAGFSIVEKQGKKKDWKFLIIGQK